MLKYTLMDNFKYLNSQVTTVNFNHHCKGGVFNSSFLSTDRVLGRSSVLCGRNKK